MFTYARFGIHFRNYTVKHINKKLKKYTDTINLPKTNFPSRLDHLQRKQVEKYILKHKISGGYHYQEQHNSAPTFVLHDGPPYANGDLHMGHAVNKILKDITLRQHVANGRKVNYIPGWDCHGLPIELKAINASDVTSQSPFKTREYSRQFAMKAVEQQKEEFRKWGILSDWQDDNVYTTLTPEFIKSQLKLFYDFYDRGLVYRDLKPVFWSPSSKTALAEAELEYDQNYVSPSVYIRFEINKLPETVIKMARNIYALVWTTTPWTIPSNQAICYNPSFEYALIKFKDSNSNEPNDLYLVAMSLINDLEVEMRSKFITVQKLEGSELSKCRYIHPIYKNKQKSLPFLSATHVQNNKGTGLVHTAPAHGPEDFLVCLAEKIPIINYVNEYGCYTDDAPIFLRGKNVLQYGNKIVLEHIANDVVFANEITHSYPIDWRTKQPVILRASEQWFLNTEVLKEQALKEIEKVEIYPRINSENHKKNLRDQIRKRPYWCISRQRSWGVPIPVLYFQGKKKVINKQLIDHLCNLIDKEGNIDFWWTKSIAELVPQSILDDLKCSSEDLIRGQDIFDIWFDSGSTWSSVLRGDKIADLYLEGCDQFTGWFQSSLLTSIASRNIAPYKSLFVHGFTVDEKGHKMSKSIGNVIYPKDIRNKYGTDVLRWWVASHGTQHSSIFVSDKLLLQESQNISKIRSTLRYINGIIGTKQNETFNSSNTSYLNKYLLSSLVDFEQEIENLYKNYEYNRVIVTIQNFTVNQVSAIYLHSIKDRLYCGEESDLCSVRLTLTECYKQLCKALWPIAPFLIEESWDYYDSQSRFQTQNIKANKAWKNPSVLSVVNSALEVKRLITKNSCGANSWNFSVRVICQNIDNLKNLQELHNKLNTPISNSELCEILQVGEVDLQLSAETHSGGTSITINTLDLPLCPRCRRYLVEHAESTCERCTKVLRSKKLI